MVRCSSRAVAVWPCAIRADYFVVYGCDLAVTTLLTGELLRRAENLSCLRLLKPAELLMSPDAANMCK